MSLTYYRVCCMNLLTRSSSKVWILFLLRFTTSTRPVDLVPAPYHSNFPHLARLSSLSGNPPDTHPRSYVTRQSLQSLESCPRLVSSTGSHRKTPFLHTWCVTSIIPSQNCQLIANSLPRAYVISKPPTSLTLMSTKLQII